MTFIKIEICKEMSSEYPDLIAYQVQHFRVKHNKLL
jgi:hypothetical protein